MSSRWELDDGIKSIKSAWQREHTARANLEKMLENVESENTKLRELVRNLLRVIPADVVGVVVGANTDHPTYYKFDEVFRELGVEV